MTAPSLPPAAWRDDLLASERSRLDQLDAATGSPPPPCRRVWAATHVVLTATGAQRASGPGHPSPLLEEIDWEATAAQRLRLDQLGFGIAEAMDTAQRYEIGWQLAERLIENCAALPLQQPFVAGASTDHLPQVSHPDQVADAWAWQARRIHSCGGIPVLLPQPALTQSGLDADAFVACYQRTLSQFDGPLWLHWLGPMFHPAMENYFPGDSAERVLALDPERVLGIKMSLLDANRERKLRSTLPNPRQRVLTGDDHHFAELIAGDADGCHSDALLGIFDAIAAPAAVALRFLAHGQRDDFLRLMRPCEALGRAVFAEPVADYKAGLAWIAWLNHWQPRPALPCAAEHRRDDAHRAQITALAAAAGVLEDVEFARRHADGRLPG